MPLSAGLKDFMERAREHGLSQAAKEQSDERSAYLQPSEEPLNWDQSGVMRLDTAIYSIHLCAARILLRALPTLVKLRLEALRRGIAEWIGIKAAGFAILTALKRLFGIITFAFELWQRIKTETEMESAIRRGCLRTMRQVLKLKMKSKKPKVRRVARVASRHP